MRFESAPETPWYDAWIGFLSTLDPWARIAALGLIVVFLLWQGWRTLRPRSALPCRWTRDRKAPRNGFTRWQCTKCGVDAFSRDGKPPKECKRGLKEAGL